MTTNGSCDLIEFSSYPHQEWICEVLGVTIYNAHNNPWCSTVHSIAAIKYYRFISYIPSLELWLQLQYSCHATMKTCHIVIIQGNVHSFDLTTSCLLLNKNTIQYTHYCTHTRTHAHYTHTNVHYTRTHTHTTQAHRSPHKDDRNYQWITLNNAYFITTLNVHNFQYSNNNLWCYYSYNAWDLKSIDHWLLKLL